MEEPMGDPQSHWEKIYETKPETAVDWYQLHSSRSLAYVTAAAGWASPIIDVGGGSSTLVDESPGAGLCRRQTTGAGRPSAGPPGTQHTKEVRWIGSHRSSPEEIGLGLAEESGK